jgi:hypothetical protein
LDDAVEDHGGRVGRAADPQLQLAQVVEDHPAGRTYPSATGVDAGHCPVAVLVQRPPHLPFDQAENQQGQADHLDQGCDAPVVLDEDRGDGQRSFEVAVAALDATRPL